MNLFVFAVFGVFRSRSCEILGFRREVDENSALLGYYAASRGNFLPTFRDYRSHRQCPREITNTRYLTTQTSSNLFELFVSKQNTSIFIVWVPNATVWKPQRMQVDGDADMMSIRLSIIGHNTPTDISQGML
jgi:hypothetical protein